MIQVSSTTGGIDFSNATQGWSVTYINATLELDTAATYATNFNVDSPGTWYLLASCSVSLKLLTDS